MTEVHSLEFQCASRVLINFSISELKLMRNAAQKHLISEYKKKLIKARPDLQDLIEQIVNVAEHTFPVKKHSDEEPEMIIPLGEDPSSTLEEDNSDEIDWDSTDDESEVGITHIEEHISTDLWPDRLNVDVHTNSATLAISIYEKRTSITVLPLEGFSSHIFWHNDIWHMVNVPDEKIMEFYKFIVREIHHLVYFFI